MIIDNFNDAGNVDHVFFDRKNKSPWLDKAHGILVFPVTFKFVAFPYAALN